MMFSPCGIGTFWKRIPTSWAAPASTINSKSLLPRLTVKGDAIICSASSFSVDTRMGVIAVGTILKLSDVERESVSDIDGELSV